MPLVTGSSDPDGDAVSYSWSQTSGTSATLSDAAAQQVRDLNGAVTQIGSGTGVNDDGSLQRGRTTLPDGTYSIFVNSEFDKIIGTFVIRIGN